MVYGDNAKIEDKILFGIQDLVCARVKLVSKMKLYFVLLAKLLKVCLFGPRAVCIHLRAAKARCC